MSGLEVAGLVLGLYPLIVSALQQYRHVHKAAGLVAHFEAEYRKILDDVKDEQLLFRMTLEQLLLPFAMDGIFQEGDVELLLSDPAHPRWNDGNLQLALEARLGSASERFIEIVNSLHLIMSQLLFSLIGDKPELQARIKKDLEDNNTNTNVGGLSSAAFQSFFKKQWRYRKEQVQFGCSGRHREQMLNDVRKHNKKLDTLLVKSKKVAKFKKSSTSASSAMAVKSLLQYWQHANRVYRFLHHSWGCQCKGQHCAHLWLQHRTSPTFEFKLLLLWAPKMFVGQRFPPWDRQGLSITTATLEDQIEQVQPAERMNSRFSESSTLVSICPNKKKKRRVGFAGFLYVPRILRSRYIELTQPRTSSPNSATSRVEPAESVAAFEVESQEDTENGLGAELSRLCDKMSESGMQAACIGSFNDHEAGRQYSVFSQPEQKISGDDITLQEVLHGSRRRELRRSDRFRIALAVASSHLQLRSTPWVSKQWEAVDIRFPMSNDEEASISFEKPFVSADFNATLPVEERPPQKANKSFACLGIMLLELLFRKCLEDHDLWQEFGSSNKANPIFRLMVARQWADEVEDEAGPEFSAAVMWCLTESPTSLDGERWRRDLADRVVLPIQRCCEWIKTRDTEP